MKPLKITAAILALCMMVFLFVSCSSSSAATSTTKTLTATVNKGNITVYITGTGNLAYADTENLAFDMAGTVDSVSVSAGDTVTKGQELVKLNTSDWEDQIASLEKALTTVQRNLVTTQSNLTKAQRQVSSKELAVKQAELDLQSTQDNVNNITEVKKYQDKVDKAQYELQFDQSMLEAAAKDPSQTMSVDFWNQEIKNDQQTLADAQADLKSALSGTNTTLSSDVVLQIAKAQLQVEQSQQALEDAKTAVADANTAVDSANQDIQDAQQAVNDAQSNLDKVKALSPVITAPFDGFITKVNVSGGDEIQKGTVAVQIADPNQFQANILVTENDIFSVKLGGDATVSLDALSNVTYPAKITKISPTATVSSGVVNYSVTIQLTSLQPVNTKQNSTTQVPSQPAAGSTSSGTLPAITPSAGTSTQPAVSSASSASTGSLQTVTLKDGLSATVEIIQQQATGVLVVPSKAITRKSQTYTVQVVNGTATETRTVQIGITDGTNTQIVQGLSEGEQITYTVSSSSSSSSSSNNQSNSLLGVGGPPGGF
jgi:HlyD family secretion protein